MASIEKVTIAGGEVRYRARWRTPGGGSRSRRFEQRRDAVAHLASVENEKAGGRYIDAADGRVTVATVAYAWSEGQLWRPSSRRKAEGVIRAHIEPRFGDREVASLRPSELQGWIRELSERRAPSTVQFIAWALKGILASAVADRLIAASPAAGLRLPSPEPRKVVPLTATQVADLAMAMAPHYRDVVLVGHATGLRPAELLGLGLDAVDPGAGIIRVERQLDEQPGKPLGFGPPKTKAAIREVPIPEEIVALILDHVAQHGEGPGGAIFTVARGGLLSTKTFRVVFAKAAAKAGLPARSIPYDLRHSFASTLIDEGASVKVLQKRLGHTSAKVTLDTYGHLMPDADERTREMIAAGHRRVLALLPPAGNGAETVSILCPPEAVPAP